MFRLTIEQGDPLGAEYEFSGGEILVGRSHEARVRLTAADVSGKHAKISVQGGGAVLENLSRHQTLLDGQPVLAPAPLKSGQKISIGNLTVLRFDEAADAPADSGGDSDTADPDATGEHRTDITGTGAEIGAAKSATPARAPAAASGEAKTMVPENVTAAGTRNATGGDALSQAGSYSGGEEDGMTRPMMTRAAGQDEIEFLRNMDRQRARSRVLLIAFAVLVVGIGAAFFATHRPEPEKTISWPVDANGDVLSASVDSPIGGFAITYPKTPDSKVTTIPGGVLVSCSLGRRHDVPFRLSLEEMVDDNNVKLTAEQAIAQWKAQMAKGGAKWNIDAPLPMNLFAGEENGIPFKTMPYQRQDEDSWSGFACVMRHGRRFIVVRAEVHSGDRARAEDLLFSRFVDPTKDFVRARWEGGRAPSNSQTADLLSRAHEELRRLAPATWDSVESLLVSALCKAVIEKKADEEKDAMDMLAALRARKSLWYNDQLCQKEAANAQGDEERVHRIAEVCKAVFSSTQDQRFFEVRKW